MRDQGAVPSMIPQGAGSAPLPGMDLKKRGKLMCVKVCLLNQTTAVFHLGHKALGEALFDEVCRYLNLLEKDYFGLEFLDCYGNRCWLDKEKTILRQITQAHSDGKFYFVVKFYTPNPSELEEEYTRYLLSLQIKRDLAMGEFICIENTAALMVAYLVQSECGDFSPDDYPDHSYLSARNFVPNQTIPFQIKVMQNHKQLIGMNPAESEFALLETARRCDFYGVKFHAAKDVEASAVNLSVVHGGIKVFQNLHFVTTFSWAKIRKLSFKRKKLLIKLHPESYQFYKETIEFGFETRNECKNFWKKCVEHHAFFRCVDVAETKKPKESRLFSRGSSFRYHGRTQKQLIDYVREHHKRREPFTRPINAGLSLERDRLARLHYGLGPSGYATLERKQQKPVSFTSSMPHIGQAPAQGLGLRKSRSGTTAFEVSTRRRPLDGSMISRTTVCSSDSDDFEVSRGPTPLSAKKRSLLSLESLGLSDFSIAIHSRSPFDCAEFHSDVAFHIVKEMLCGEWTTQNELRLVNEHYFGDLKRSAPERCHVVDEFVVLLAAVQTGAEERTVELEHTVRNWKDSSMAIGNVLLCLMHNSIPQFRALLAQMPVFVAASHQLTSMHGPISDRIRALDAEGRLFFVDILWTVVRLAYKTVTWQNSLGRLVECFLEVQHMALGQTRIALEKISAFNRETEKTRENVNDYVKLIQLEQILNASRQLVQPNRKFVREGFAQVITAQGAVPSMVVLFRDSLLLASACTRRASRTIDFSVDSHIPLREITYEDKSSAIGITHCGSPLLLSFASEDIQRLWMRDLDASVRSAKEMPLRLLPEVVAPERKVVSFADSVVDSRSNGSTAQPPSKVPPKALEPSSKAPFLSCWLRQKTISAVRQNLSVQRQLSGYLFRRRSVVHEWQLLWAQISGTQNLMLYLSHTDLKPLAIIDLIGCFVGVPSVDETVSEESEEVGKNNYLFKVKVDLQQSFIFRVESRHDLVRWITEIHESSSLDREPGPLDPLTMLAIT